MTYTKHKFDYEGKQWGASRIENKRTSLQGGELDFIEAVLGMKPGKSMKLLDLGCGDGNVLAYLKRKFPKHNYSGVDMSKSATKRAKASNKDINFYSSTSDQLPFGRNHFNFVLGLDTLEHLEKLDATLLEVKRVLKDDGLFIVAIPLEKQFPTFYFWLNLLGWRGKAKFSGHVNFFNNRQFVDKMKSHGFKLKRMRFADHLIFSFFDIAYYFFQALFGKVESFDKLKEEKFKILRQLSQLVSFVSYFESKMFFWFPGGKGHYVFEK